MYPAHTRKAISMTESVPEPLTFSRLQRQSIHADFHGGRLTSDWLTGTVPRKARHIAAEASPLTRGNPGGPRGNVGGPSVRACPKRKCRLRYGWTA